MASDFLNNLKKTVEAGEFNSEAAKKINAITELAEDKTKGINFTEEYVADRLKEIGGGVTPAVRVTEEEAAATNFAYETKMTEIKKQDAVNLQVATLIDIEDMLKASVIDMFSFIAELEDQFAKEFEAEEPIFGDLHLKIEELKSKYKSLI